MKRRKYKYQLGGYSPTGSLNDPIEVREDGFAGLIGEDELKEKQFRQQQHMNMIGAGLGAAGQVLENSNQLNINDYTNERERTTNQVDAGIGAVGAINPLVAGFMKLGQGIGKQTIDEDGLYKNKVGEFIDNNVNPTTGIQNLKDFSKDITWSTAANQLTGGLFGTSASQKKAEKAKFQAALQKQDMMEDLITGDKLANYDFQGNQDERNIYALGGKLKRVNSDTVEVEGNTHAEGGVKLPNAEVEDEETIAGNYVFSDILGFAEQHKPIARQIGKIERKPLNRERRVSLEILRKKEATLRNEQEQVHEELSVSDPTTRQMGGRLPRYNADTPYPVALDEPKVNPLTTGAALTEPQGTPIKLPQRYIPSPDEEVPIFSLDEWKSDKQRDWNKYPLTAPEIKGWTEEKKARNLARQRTELDKVRKPIIPSFRRTMLNRLNMK